MENKIVKVYVLKGLNGTSLVIENYRVSDEKIYGMLTPIYTFEVATDDILQAIGHDDCVSLETYKQVTSERDIAIEQLKELGYSFGEKIRTSDDCVSRQALINSYNGIETPVGYRKVVDMQVIEDLPPVTPTFPKGATNGDMIKAMYPKIEIYTDVINEIVDVEICEDSSELRCSVDWWNAPYKGVEE